MIPLDDLKKIFLLQHFTDSMLEELRPRVESRKAKEQEIIFNQHDPADTFFMLKRGKVLLEVEVSPYVMMSLGSVKSGRAFGWTALSHAHTSHESNALCTEPSEILSVAGSEFLQILDRHPEVGYWVMKYIFDVFEQRLERRTTQLINVIRNYPEMKELVRE